VWIREAAAVLAMSCGRNILELQINMHHFRGNATPTGFEIRLTKFCVADGLMIHLQNFIQIGQPATYFHDDGRSGAILLPVSYRCRHCLGTTKVCQQAAEIYFRFGKTNVRYIGILFLNATSTHRRYWPFIPHVSTKFYPTVSLNWCSA